MEHYKISKLLNDSTVWIEVNNLLSDQYSEYSASKNIKLKFHVKIRYM